jgi:hypothetical protein
MGWTSCRCGDYLEHHTDVLILQTSLPRGVKPARRTLLHLPLSAAKSCLLLCRRSSVANIMFVKPTLISLIYIPICGEYRHDRYPSAKMTRSGSFGGHTKVGKGKSRKCTVRNGSSTLTVCNATSRMAQLLPSA